MRSDVHETRPRVAALRRSRRLAGLVCTLMLLTVPVSTSCVTRMLTMPAAETLPSPAGDVLEVEPIADQRPGSVLGDLDTITIDSGPDLVSYVGDQLANSLSRLGFTVRQVDQNAPMAGHKRVRASLLSAELSSESTLRFPVAAAVRLRIEVVDELGQSTFRKEVRGATSRDLGLHTQGGPEDAQLLAEVIDEAFQSLAVDESFIVAIRTSREEAAERQISEEEFRKAATKSATGVSEKGQTAESIAERLGTLDRLLAEGLINQEDYDRKRRGILGDL